MKKFITIALAATALAACTKENTLQTADKVAIAFENALILPKTSQCEVVLGKIAVNEKTGEKRLKKKEEASAVIVRNAYEGGECKLHVYIPQNRRPKGKKRNNEPMVLCEQNCVDDKYICHHVEYSESCIFCAFNPPKGVKKHA